MEKLIVFGCSGSGKTSAVDFVRARKDVDAPKRYVTRGNRLNDNLVENTHVADEEFEQMVKVDNIVHPWQRDLGPDKGIVSYGFAPMLQRSGLVAVYSANNAFPFSESGQRLLAEGAWPVLIDSIKEARIERLRKRSPDLMGSELEKRLEPVPSRLLEIPGLIVIENPQLEHSSDITPAALALDGLIDFIQANRPSLGDMASRNNRRICGV